MQAMSGGCTIRLARSEDAARIAELGEALDHLHRAEFPALLRPAGARLEPDWVIAALQAPASALFVAEQLESIVGFLRVRDVETPGGAALLPRRYGLIDELYVEPAARGAGVAHALLLAAEVWARDRGVTALEVTVWDFNNEAQQFYEREGFGVLRHYLRKPIEARAPAAGSPS